MKKCDFQFSEITDEKMICLIDMFNKSRDVYSEHKFDAGTTRQKFDVTLKPNLKLIGPSPSKLPLHLKENLEKLLTQLKDADIIREMVHDDEM